MVPSTPSGRCASAYKRPLPVCLTQTARGRFSQEIARHERRKAANVAATGVLAVFDRAIAAAEALLAAHPVPPSLTDAQIRRMAAAAGT